MKMNMNFTMETTNIIIIEVITIIEINTIEITKNTRNTFSTSTNQFSQQFNITLKIIVFFAHLLIKP
jgi:hypothetical protein